MAIEAMSADMERQRLRALVDRDMATADRLHAETYQLVTPGGTTLSQAGYLGSILGGSLRYRVFEPIGEMAVLIAGEMAAVRYRCHLELMSEGQIVITDAWHTDIWQVTSEGWQAVWSQATAIPT